MAPGLVVRNPVWQQPAGLASQHLESRFFKSFLSRDVALGMKWTRHQLAPAVPNQKIVDRAVAGRMPDRLFIGRLEIVDIQHLARPGGLGKTRQQSLLPGKRHVLALAAADRLRLERLDPAVVIGHVGAVHGAQRNSHRRRDRRLRHPALAQQYHLDALTLCRWDFPPQRRLQFPYLAFAAFDHRFPRIDGQSESHRAPKRLAPRYRKTRRFNPIWKRYERPSALRSAKCIDGRNPAFRHHRVTTFRGPQHHSISKRRNYRTDSASRSGRRAAAADGEQSRRAGCHLGVATRGSTGDRPAQVGTAVPSDRGELSDKRTRRLDHCRYAQYVSLLGVGQWSGDALWHRSGS